MVVDDDQQKAEVKICRKTCQSIFDDCKDDDGFRDKEGMKPDNANQVCAYIDQLDDDDIEIKITDNALLSTHRNGCLKCGSYTL